MRYSRRSRPRAFFLLPFATVLLLVLAACGGGSSPNNTSNAQAGQQVLRFPNVGISDIARLDPASGPDANSNLAIDMIFSGLVKADKNLNVTPDQATWDISNNNTVYTFHIKPGITFSDGTPVTAQTYVTSWTRALLPEVKSPIAYVLMQNIVGANDVNTGKSKALTGVKAIDDQTLQVTLVQPTAYFLQVLTVNLFYPLNPKLVDQYGQNGWIAHAAGSGVGTGPFMIKSWTNNVKMVLVPNPHYYGAKTKLTEVDMAFVKDPATAFKAYRAGQYDLVWNLTPVDQQTAKDLPGFERQSILESDLLFFDNKTEPFKHTAVRQAFAAAIDKQELAHAIYKDTVTPANTIIPPGQPGAQPDYPGIQFDKAKARQLLQSVYPDVSKMPPVAFTYPSSQISQDMIAALQQMWQNALGIQVKMNGMELATYNNETSKHAVQFGFTQWGVYFPDPYEWLDLSLLSHSPNNNGDWSNPDFDKLVAQAEQKSGQERLDLYQQAERIAVDNVGWLPLDHQSQAVVISPKVHGISLNSQGLYFGGDWSGVYVTQ